MRGLSSAHRRSSARSSDSYAWSYADVDGDRPAAMAASDTSTATATDVEAGKRRPRRQIHLRLTRRRRWILLAFCVLVGVAAVFAAVFALVMNGMNGNPFVRCSGANREKFVMVVGSSVARGKNAYWLGFPFLRNGWAFLLGRRLCESHGLQMVNAAVPGNTVSKTRSNIATLLAEHRPKAVVIGLSTANEGLSSSQDLEAANASAVAFEKALYALAGEIAAYPTVDLVVLGGVYPNNRYRDYHVEALRQLNDRMLVQSSYPVIDFLVATDNGSGGWRENEWYDAGHPNSAGHRAMFEALDASTLARFGALG